MVWELCVLNTISCEIPSCYAASSSNCYSSSCKINKKINYKVLSLTYKSPKLLFSFIPFTSLYLVFISYHLILVTYRLKIAYRSYNHSARVLWNSLPSETCLALSFLIISQRFSEETASSTLEI